MHSGVQMSRHGIWSLPTITSDHPDIKAQRALVINSTNHNTKISKWTALSQYDWTPLAELSGHTRSNAPDDGGDEFCQKVVF